MQRRIAHLLSPLWLPLLAVAMRWGMGWRIANARRMRRAYRQLRRKSSGPLLICANHLTMVDSALVAWALGAPWWYVLNFDALPWNVPERANFARTWWQRAAVYLMKCIPIHRGGERGELAGALAHFTSLVATGDVGLIFPEGGRSRSGRIDPAASTYGVGRIVKALPGCRVLCLYLRGEGQTSWSRLPARGEVFHASWSVLEPHTEQKGLRGSLDITQQIVVRLAEMEQRYLARHEVAPPTDGERSSAGSR